MRWEKTFELVVPDPVVSVRKAFLETDDPQAWNRVFTGDPYFSGGAVRVATHETESDLAWEEIEGEDHIEMTVTFRETATGTTMACTSED